MARVLVIDDDATYLALMKGALQQRGHYVCAVNDAEAAREALSETYDTVVCDIVLPTESGLHLMRGMRTANPAIGIVAISGGVAHGGRRAVDVLHMAQVTSADAVIRKPFEMPAFVKTVETVLAAARAKGAERQLPAGGRTLTSPKLANAKRVLVIDDDQLFVTLMAQTLKECGYDVETAMDGEEGARAFAASRFDAVVCDIVMPGQEGLETMWQMRVARPDLAIVAVSGGVQIDEFEPMDSLEIAARFGADATLKKPFELCELSAVVDRALSIERASKAARS
jgi:DNA-binding NtrC family response regulator